MNKHYRKNKTITLKRKKFNWRASSNASLYQQTLERTVYQVEDIERIKRFTYGEIIDITSDVLEHLRVPVVGKSYHLSPNRMLFYSIVKIEASNIDTAFPHQTIHPCIVIRYGYSPYFNFSVKPGLLFNNDKCFMFPYTSSGLVNTDTYKGNFQLYKSMFSAFDQTLVRVDRMSNWLEQTKSIELTKAQKILLYHRLTMENVVRYNTIPAFHYYVLQKCFKGRLNYDSLFGVYGFALLTFRYRKLVQNTFVKQSNLFGTVKQLFNTKLKSYDLKVGHEDYHRWSKKGFQLLCGPDAPGWNNPFL